MQLIKCPRRIVVYLAACLIGVGLANAVQADPCGLVWPVTIETGATKIQRTGLQKTYVFHHAGIESFIIHPGFRGNVKNFGMLIPFPSVPAIRKVPGDVFAQIEKSVDPPEVIVDLRPSGGMPHFGYGGYGGGGYGGMGGGYGGEGMSIAKDETRVLRQEAVGMYDVAVLQAGSSAALSRWMEDNQYRYPAGMDDACDDYIADGWCFVAVRSRIGHKGLVDPAAGQRDVDPELQDGMRFDGHVQAMGFRFKSEKLVVPMRLSTYNEGDLRNLLYVLTDQPVAINNIDSASVVRQISGRQLIKTLTSPLPLRLIGGSVQDIAPILRQVIQGQRSSSTAFSFSKDLYASDLSCALRGELTNERESLEKQLVNISERLGLRGGDLDLLHRAAADEALKAGTTESDLSDLAELTLTVIDGDFPREVLARENLTFHKFEMASSKNSRSDYCVPLHGPLKNQPDGELYFGKISWKAGNAQPQLGGQRIGHRVSPGTAQLAMSVYPSSLAALYSIPQDAAVPESTSQGLQLKRQLLRQLALPEFAGDASDRLAQMGDTVVSDLSAAALGPDLPLRGWAIATLAQIGSPKAIAQLKQLADHSASELNKLWLSAARLSTAPDTRSLLANYTEQSNISLLQVAKSRLETILQMQGSSDTAALIAAGITNPAAKRLLDPVIVDRGYAAIARVCYPGAGGRTQEEDLNAETLIRRTAAGYLAAMAQEDPNGVAQAVATLIAFDPSMESPPWGTGPLFLPQMRWPHQVALRLYIDLANWWEFGAGENVTAIQVNLRSLGNYVSPTAGNASSPRQCLAAAAYAMSFAETVAITKMRDANVAKNTFVQKCITAKQEPLRAYYRVGMRGAPQLVWILKLDNSKPVIARFDSDGLNVKRVSAEDVYSLSNSNRLQLLAGPVDGTKPIAIIHDPGAIRNYGITSPVQQYGAIAEYRGHKNIPVARWAYLYPSWYVWPNRNEQ